MNILRKNNMQELECVREKLQNKYRVVKTDEDLEWNRAIDLCTNIINAHLSRENATEIARSSRDNDGWIPVEERLPDNNENVLVTTDMGLIASGYIAHGTWITDQEPDYPIAWRPLPEPYRPEPETEKPDWRQDMLRKFDRRD